MAAHETTVAIEGLRELRRELNRYGIEANKIVKVAHRDVGNMIVKYAHEAARSAPPSRGKRHSNRYAQVYAAALKASPTVRSARAAARGAWYHGAEFGSGISRARAVRKGTTYWLTTGKQFPKWTGNQYGGEEPGNVAYAGLREHVGDIRERYGDAIYDAFRKAFPEHG